MENGVERGFDPDLPFKQARRYEAIFLVDRLASKLERWRLT